MLTLQRLRKLLLYYPNTGHFIHLEDRKGGARAGDLAGWQNTARGQKRIKISVDGRTYMAHRLAYFYMTSKWPTADIDHRNGDGFDNRWSNLRAATRSQNNANRPTAANVYRDSDPSLQKPKWRARIKKDGVTVYLGGFATRRQAVAAYREAKRYLFGEYAGT